MRPWLVLASIPLLTTVMLLWVDAFNLTWALALPAAPGGVTLAQSKAAVSSGASAVTPHKSSHEGGARSTTAALRPLSSPAVGASIAVHPPKFYAAAKFLEQFAACPGAMRVLSVFLVFTDGKDLQLFQEALARISPELPPDLWTPVVAVTPKGGWRAPIGVANQMIAAYKKWHGIVHMMDLKKEFAPAYGLMMDAELLLYDGLGGDTRGEDCRSDGPWSELPRRIQELEDAKAFPAARVSSTLTAYNFGHFTRSGKDYDQSILRDNAHFLGPEVLSCNSRGCQEVQQQVEKCLFSWWTDLPWVNLTVAGTMLQWVSTRRSRPGGSPSDWRPTAGWSPAEGWRNLSSGISFKRFEYVAYQQWCVLREGFHFLDVTNLTGEAKWGSYMEDPLPGAQLGQLWPLWISGQALERVERGSLPPLSSERPPLLIFHADQGRPRAGREANKAKWEKLLLELLKSHGRKDFDKQSIK